MAKITFDPAKRAWTIETRDLDFCDAARILEGSTLTVEDDRRDYGELRYLTYGFLGERLAFFAWTPRGDAHHVFSMRYCHEREARKILAHVGWVRR